MCGKELDIKAAAAHTESYYIMDIIEILFWRDMSGCWRWNSNNTNAFAEMITEKERHVIRIGETLNVFSFAD